MRVEIPIARSSEVIDGRPVFWWVFAHCIDTDWPWLNEIPVPLDPAIPSGGEAPRAVLAERWDDIGPEIKVRLPDVC